MGYETICRSRSGKDVSLIFNAKSLRDAAGSIRGTQGTAFDITDRKKSEEKAGVDHRRMMSLLRISKSKTISQKELLDLALEEAVALSESKLGFFCYYNEGKQEFTLPCPGRRPFMKERSLADPRKDLSTGEDRPLGRGGTAARARYHQRFLYAPSAQAESAPKGMSCCTAL